MEGVAWMSPVETGLALFAAMLGLMALRVPIAIAMFISGAVGYALLTSSAVVLNHLKGAAWARLSVYDRGRKDRSAVVRREAAARPPYRIPAGSPPPGGLREIPPGRSWRRRA
jgi:hypothetical protein